MPTLGDVINQNRKSFIGTLTDTEIDAVCVIQLPLDIFTTMDQSGQLMVLTRTTGIDQTICEKLVLPIIYRLAQVTVSVTINQQTPTTPPTSMQQIDPIAAFNFGLGKRMTDRRFMEEIRNAAWVAAIESTGLRQWIHDNFDQGAARFIQDPTLKSKIGQWLRQYEVRDHSTYINLGESVDEKNRLIEIVGNKIRSEATTFIVDMLAKTELDIIMAAIAEYRRGSNRASVLEVLGLNGVTTQNLPDPDELSHQIEALLEDLNRLYAEGLHSDNCLALIKEYQQIIYPALADPDFIAGINGIRVGNRNPIEALQDYMPQNIRFGLQMAQNIYTVIDRIGKFDENGDLNAQYLDLAPLAQQYGLAAKDYGRTLGNKIASNGFVGIVGLSAYIKIRLGGVEVQVGVNVQADPMLALRYTYSTGPAANPIPKKDLSVTAGSIMASYIFKVHNGSVRSFHIAMVNNLPSGYETELTKKVTPDTNSHHVLWIRWESALGYKMIPNTQMYHGLGSKSNEICALAVVLMNLAALPESIDFREQLERLAYSYAVQGY